jgi:PAB-dependent poly(A)-specific ribonuclease subunit 3
VGPYHTLYPLEDLTAAEEHPSAALGVRTCVVKGVSAQDGQAYALRRVDGKQARVSDGIHGQKAMQVKEQRAA